MSSGVLAGVQACRSRFLTHHPSKASNPRVLGACVRGPVWLSWSASAAPHVGVDIHALPSCLTRRSSGTSLLQVSCFVAVQACKPEGGES